MILNLTQHAATPEQVAAKVIEPSTEDKAKVQALLTFASLPSFGDIVERAASLAEIAKASGATEVMIGGAPYLMGPLENALRGLGIRPLYAFSIRESVETTAPDGSIRKTAVFRHRGFIEA